ncbi:MAG: beta-ketoacyl-ACP reductase [Alphaproteobacteria bacterium CG11_big_fil_rev_8_21_14_0_20_39_49]|nr:MAG: beta-ketoacyl-ACP reductase [Alphaproteobacteria bacterium CG11_big_fil_rev_8_21_14_0_20_39_49]
MFDLSGKTALVTGASGGIGKAIATSLYEQGATVILSGRREEALKEVASSLGERTHIVTCDLADKEQVDSLFDRACEIAGQVDILVCNAGIAKDNLVLRMKDEEFDEVISTNLKATFTLNKAAFKKMMKKKWGRIINIASVVGVSGNPGQANYVASKAGMIGMSKSIAAEAAVRGITVNCIAPGFIKTAMTDALNDAQKEKITSTIPAGTFGLPEDIAAAAAFLASDEARYITGQTIHVNGGMLMV